MELEKNMSFNELNENFWNCFKRYLIDKEEHSQSTIYTVLSIMKAILNRAVKEKVIRNNPLQYIKEKRPKSNRCYLTLDEFEKT